MPPVTQVIDPLWHCLCPSFYALSGSCIQVPRLMTRNAPRSTAISRPGASQSLIHHTCWRSTKKKTCSLYLRQFVAKKFYATHDSPFANPEDERTLRRLSHNAIWEELRKASSKGIFIRVQRIVRILVAVHGERPSQRLYTALILANTCPKYGSVQEVEHTLGEMAQQDLSPDSAVYHAVLKVWSIWVT